MYGYIVHTLYSIHYKTLEPFNKKVAEVSVSATFGLSIIPVCFLSFSTGHVPEYTFTQRVGDGYNNSHVHGQLYAGAHDMYRCIYVPGSRIFLMWRKPLRAQLNF